MSALEVIGVFAIAVGILWTLVMLPVILAAFDEWGYRRRSAKRLKRSGCKDWGEYYRKEREKHADS